MDSRSFKPVMTLFSMSRILWRSCVVFAFVVTGFLLWGTVGCSTTEPVKAITLKFQHKPVSMSFSVGDWKVTLTNATLSLKALRLYEGKPAFSDSSLLPSLFSVAHAHPGHSEPGALKGEILWDKPLNLLGDSVVSLGEHQAFSGYVGAGELVLDKASTMKCTGKASRGSTEIRFDWEIKLGENTVFGIPLDKTLSAISPPVVYSFNLPGALEKLGLDSLKVDDKGVVDLKEGSPEANILRKAILNTRQHTLSLKSDL